MAWSTPSDFAVQYLVNENDWNAVAGAAGNVVFVHTSVNTVVGGSTANTFGPTYQNTTALPKMVNIPFTAATAVCSLRIGSTSPPSHLAAVVNVANAAQMHTLSAMVPSAWYYSASGGGTAVVWYEWNFYAS